MPRHRRRKGFVLKHIRYGKTRKPLVLCIPLQRISQFKHSHYTSLRHGTTHAHDAMTQALTQHARKSRRSTWHVAARAHCAMTRQIFQNCRSGKAAAAHKLQRKRDCISGALQTSSLKHAIQQFSPSEKTWKQKTGRLIQARLGLGHRRCSIAGHGTEACLSVDRTLFFFESNLIRFINGQCSCNNKGDCSGDSRTRSGVSLKNLQSCRGCRKGLHFLRT